jgi:selenocysteine-specific elongation factor
VHVVGTAGHVDHGKSTLVHALTGIDPDRLREEKERGMTIDLGFAWLRLPNGEEISIVDVPGHERFIKNMLAGVGGIDLALLVIAADEGVMPQTIEHVAILDLLRVRRAIVALTKVDAVEPDWLELVTADAEEYLNRTGLAGSPICPVSAHTGAGIDDLVATLTTRLADTPTRPSIGRPRIPVDRVFTVAGFGTVVTGTLIGGELTVGQEVEVMPGNLRARARGIQSHKERVASAGPGSRVAVNLAGLSTDDVHRGQTITTPGWLRATSAADVDLAVIAQAPHPLAHGSTMTFHTGAAEVEARVLLFEGEALAAGAHGWGQLRFHEPVAIVKGDLFVLRTPNATVAGGEIVDPTARRHRRRDANLVESLRILREGTPTEAALGELRARGALEIKALGERLGMPLPAAREIAVQLIAEHGVQALGDFVMLEDSWRRLSDEIGRVLGEFHRGFPLRSGMPREELRGRLRIPSRLFVPTLSRLAAEGTLVDRDGVVRDAAFRPTLTADQTALADRLIATLNANPFTPPSISDLPIDARPDGELLHALAAAGRLILVADDIAYSPEAFADMRDRVVARLTERGTITVADARDLFGSSRRFALALLEYLDQQRITRRVGDDRVLL